MPLSLFGPLPWKPTDFLTGNECVVGLAKPELSEISQALQYFNFSYPGINLRLDLSPPSPVQDSPRASPRALRRPGLLHLHGLIPSLYSKIKMLTIYLVISAHVGSIHGRQDSLFVAGVRKSSMLNHITNLQKRPRYGGKIIITRI
ncbi:hypothetical protein L207DRAFT_589123 [Hyaloscypha variabilis F]|uniref:Uncharacterized protein n=1 Tax=Hyaloscypha variabilis (strain UAMH 11265 / GT02V1 / F) TaxID=1149755 RepID=A0A2J6R4W4_HYAVF|nr:hypothetical protein L207DRAFT_589123 [Hyaloscypha variabilis F]